MGGQCCCNICVDGGSSSESEIQNASRNTCNFQGNVCEYGAKRCLECGQDFPTFECECIDGETECRERSCDELCDADDNNPPTNTANQSEPIIPTCYNVNGLPCFDFFFEAECPKPLFDPSVYRNCKCKNGMTELEFEYIGSENVSVTFLRGRNTVYDSFEVSQGDIISLTPLPAKTFKTWTYVAINDKSGQQICGGRVKRCRQDIIDSAVYGCADLIIRSWTAGDGALCDVYSVDLSDSSSADNAFVGSEEKEKVGTFAVFDNLDPFVKYSLIGVIVTFFILIIVAGYIFIAAQFGKNKHNIVEMDDVEKEIANAKKQNEENELLSTIEIPSIVQDENGEFIR